MTRDDKLDKQSLVLREKLQSGKGIVSAAAIIASASLTVIFKLIQWSPLYIHNSTVHHMTLRENG